MFDYKTKVKFALDKKVRFPDFDLIYKGIISIPGPNKAKFKITKYVFRIISIDGNSKLIFWSSGTGVIAPRRFEFNNIKYTLELRFSENINAVKLMDKKLEDDELVISEILYV